MQKLLILFSFFFFTLGCKQKTVYIKPVAKDDVLTIAFGSCSDHDKKQPLWDDILNEAPDLWIWLGDNVYGDTEDMDVLRSKYDAQLAHPGYQAIMDQCPIIGTWDDHDYGINNGGKEFPMKAESQVELLDFLKVPADDPRRHREGVYTSYDLKNEIANVKVLLLDNRYFRDEVTYNNGIGQPNYDGTCMGEAQWQWLEEELRNSKADVHIFASGIQVIPVEHRFEKWGNFPNEQKKLYDMILELKVKRPLFISGDRHIGEISARDWKSIKLYEITSSSLTHGWMNKRSEVNMFRIGDIVYDMNYGLLEIRKNDGIEVIGSIKNENGITPEAMRFYD